MTMTSMTTMLTYTGKAIDLANFKEDDVRLADISHSLSMINRFTGHTKQPYSVAQHSVLVSKLVDPRHAIWGLLHDASEAYLGDVATPLKMMLPNYIQLEEAVQKAIASKFGMKWPMPYEVKEADLTALLMERRDLVPGGKELGVPLNEAAGEVVPVGWEEAKKMFEDRYKELIPC